MPSSGLVLLGGWLWWWSGQRVGPTSWVSVEGGGEQGAGDVQAQEQARQGDDQAAAAPHDVLLSGGLGWCLLVGLRSSPAPGDRVSPGRLDDGRVKGRRRRPRRDAKRP